MISRKSIGLVLRFLMTIGAALTLNCTSAQDHQVVSVLEPADDSWTEDFTDTPAVSGGVLIGLRDTGSNDRLADKTVYVYLPASHSRSLCLTINTVDGRFRAQAEYDIEGLGKGDYGLRLTTERVDYLTNLTNVQEIALLAQLAPGCRNVDVSSPVLGTRLAHDESDDLIMLLNTGSATDVNVSFPHGNDRADELDCHPLDNQLTMVRYNLACRMVRHTTDCGGELAILRRSFGVRLPSISHEVLVC